MGYAFISHSSDDLDSVEKICAILKDKGVETWKAPEEIIAGEDYFAEITRAIKCAACMVLVLTNNSQESEHVKREVRIAVEENIKIIPLALEEIKLNNTLKYALAGKHIALIKDISVNCKELMDAVGNIKAIIDECNTTKETRDIFQEETDSISLGDASTFKESELSDTLNRSKSILDKKEDLSLEKKDAETWYQLGRKDRSGNLKVKAAYYRKAAEAGHVEAQYILGYLYSKGRGVEQDYEKQVYWYQKAAEQGHVKAQYNLAERYRYNKGEKRNLGKAFYWYQEAAKQGDARSQYKLGECYDKGIGVEKDSKQAFYWYQKAAEQGDALAQYCLGEFYCKGTGVQKDPKQAFCWYQKAAEQKNSRAQCKLGECYDKGIGVEKNKKKALYWYQEAANRRNKDAEEWLINHAK